MNAEHRKLKSCEGAMIGKIRILALDFDGIFTDGMVYVDQNGVETVKCSRRDGFGTELLKRAGLYVCVISREPNPVVKARCEKLKIDCWHNVETAADKLEVFNNVLSNQKANCWEAAYMGDELNDLKILRVAGFSATVPEAHPEVQKVVHYITKASGGRGAIREVVELILKAQGYDLEKLS